MIQKLKQIENRGIAHKMAHKGVAGKYAGAVTYQYTRDPDGKLYITGGEVFLDTREERQPEDTIKKMEIIIAAALAPADPSPQDIRVAQIAAIKKRKAQIEVSQKNEEKSNDLSLQILFFLYFQCY
ncbi:MAG: hypothetical protein N2042_01075 [Thermodesulfovibrio sp.]|nr:hypothetical protein [Thermodesulfovibrio sp.]